ncbi:MAG: alanine racemase [Desulfobacterium sp.]|jgi:alanine racemase|nr:alanine racemase [Desulfobacterium sp.]
MQKNKEPTCLVWRQIDLNAISHNIKALKSLTRDGTAFMAVVKADAYGHGAVKVSKKALESGATHLGVARVHEALELRKAGISAPILVFGYILEPEVDKLMDLGITATVSDLETAAMLSERAVARSTTLKAHLKVDTGMGRLGILPDSRRADSNKGSALDEAAAIAALAGLELEGIYTHFSAADSKDKSYSLYQLRTFLEFIQALKDRGIGFPMVHGANSAALIELAQTHFTMVRAGIAMYGLTPSGEVDIEHLNLKPAMEIRSIVSSVKEVPASFKVSYGMTYETRKKSVIAAVPIGYADGFSRLFSSRGEMIVRGRRAAIAGRVCMDQTLIDVGEIPGVIPGDSVVILGDQGGQSITADQMAKTLGTINYEVVSSLTARVPQIYSE